MRYDDWTAATWWTTRSLGSRDTWRGELKRKLLRSYEIRFRCEKKKKKNHLSSSTSLHAPIISTITAVTVGVIQIQWVMLLRPRWWQNNNIILLYGVFPPYTLWLMGDGGVRTVERLWRRWLRMSTCRRKVYHSGIIWLFHIIVVVATDGLLQHMGKAPHGLTTTAKCRPKQRVRPVSTCAGLSFIFSNPGVTTQNVFFHFLLILSKFDHYFSLMYCFLKFRLKHSLSLATST